MKKTCAMTALACAILVLSTGCVCVTTPNGRLPPVTSFPRVPEAEKPSLSTFLTVYGNAKSQGNQYTQAAINAKAARFRNAMNASGMFSSVVFANNAQEQRTEDYTVLMEWHDAAAPNPGSAFLFLASVFVLPFLEHNDITLTARIRDNRTGETRQTPAIKQRWNMVCSWFVIPFVAFGACEVTDETIQNTMCRTMALRIHETIKAWPKKTPSSAAEKILLLKEWLKDGLITREEYEEKAAPLKDQLLTF